MGQAVVTVAIGTIFFLAGAGEERFVLLGVDLTGGMTAHTERINLRPRIHNARRRAVFTPGPGFVGNVRITVTVAIRAANIGPCVDNGDILLHIVHMANVAATVISYGSSRQADVWAILKQ